MEYPVTLLGRGKGASLRPAERFANHLQSRPAAGRSGAPVARGLTSAIRLEPPRAAEAKPATGVTEAIVG